MNARKTLRLALIYGSTRAGRFCDTIADWTRGEIARHGGFAVNVIDPARTAEDDVAASLAAADAFVVLVPEYNHGYPAPLKALIDAHYDEWQAKPVAFVSYGGISGGIRAVEQLRQVFAELHAVGVRDAVSFSNAAEQFDEHGCLRNPARARRSAATMLARLHWWAAVLREARRARPYAEALA
ncbi:NADPH-dependent FMN reductase [Sinimarinibacterium flocculans]|uniref:NADPH-dependent FMN reductase n=1 Tax=Sinimarinibacterium flocculans TaxID=985250 RepID=UPI003517A06B